MATIVGTDTQPVLTGIISRLDGTPADLTGATVTLHLATPTPTVKTATVSAATAGQVQWRSDGTLPVGRWNAWWVVTWPDRTVQHAPDNGGHLVLDVKNAP